MDYTVNPIITRGMSYGKLLVVRGYSGILFKVRREVIRLVSGVTRTVQLVSKLYR